MTFKNMKIPVENNLDEIVAELKRLGMQECIWGRSTKPRYIYVFKDGVFRVDGNYQPAFDHVPITNLAELKEM